MRFSHQNQFRQSIPDIPANHPPCIRRRWIVYCRKTCNPVSQMLGRRSTAVACRNNLNDASGFRQYALGVCRIDTDTGKVLSVWPGRIRAALTLKT